MEKIKEELALLKMEKEALSYKRFWDGADYAKNRQLTDRIYQITRELAKIK